MRSIHWLQISDFHLRESQEWAQDVVLSEMCRDIERRRRETGSIDFVLATGDLAFSGKYTEYELARSFFDEVVRVSGVPREYVYFIPGNHDVDRSKQNMAFAGARHTLHSENEVDRLLGSPEELDTLRERQANYYRFQDEYLAGQQREWTPDRLGYVSMVTVEDLRIAIVGLNSAWLAEGGTKDHGKLLIGERQVIDALSIVRGMDAHLIVGMGHHPFHLLCEFDYRAVQRRMTETCHFYHCGHLHDPDAYRAGRTGTHCLTVAAGASFESRSAHNAYSFISLDVMQAQSTVTTVQYKPSDGAFSYEENQHFPFIVEAVAACGIGALGHAVATSYPSLEPVSHLLAALLLGRQTEVPIKMGDICTFGSLDVMRDQANSALRSATLEFMALRNPLGMFSVQMLPDEFVLRYGSTLETYGNALIALGDNVPGFTDRLADREVNARALAETEPLKSFAHTLALMQKLGAEQDWDILREQAGRHLDAPDAKVALEAKRMLALALANSEDDADKAKAIEIYQGMFKDGSVGAEDVAALVSLLIGAGNYQTARATLREGIDHFPRYTEQFLSLGYMIVEATGDRDFRDTLRVQQEGRGAE